MRNFSQMSALCGLATLSIICGSVLGAAYAPAQAPLSSEYFDPTARDPLVDEYASGAIHWDYTAGSGPLMWTRMNKKEWPLCANGDIQSPINIDSRMKPSGFKYEWSGPQNACYNMTNNGHTIELLPTCSKTQGEDFEAEDARMGIMIDDDWFNLQHIHFHTPSEHRYLEEYFPLEVHFVMKSTKTHRFAVRGILFDITSGRESDFFDGISPNLRKVTQEGQWTKVAVNTINIMKVFQDMGVNNKVYNYQGSLTTPPCTQNVIWDVLSVPQPVSVDTYNRFKRIVKFNSRYTQENLGKGNLIQEACGKK